MSEKNSVAVAMSGGVDSSVAACILKQQGFNVIGVTMRVWSCKDLSERKKLCYSLTDLEDAKKVAYILGIPHYVIDLRKEFEKFVIEPLLKNYLNGFTPNPCVLCNQKIKFDFLLRKILSMGINYLATGHYARIIKVRSSKEDGQFLLKKAKDINSDQSYWLYSIPKCNLKYVLFPLGDLTKEKVREIAKNYSLHVAEKPKSQELCFITNGDYRKFLESRLKNSRSGNIIDINGNLIGKHNGIFQFTIGQRTGLNISTGKRIYVKDIIPQENKVIICERKELYKSECNISNVNWIIEGSKYWKNIKVRIRYKHEEANAEIYQLKKDLYRIKFKEPQFAITPGQSAVVYYNDIVLGGGIIQRC